MKRVMCVLAAALPAAVAAGDPVELRFQAAELGQVSHVAPQLRCIVSDAGAGAVSFAFSNAATVTSSVMQVYFSDAGILGPASLQQQGTAFLPGGGVHSPRHGAGLLPGFTLSRVFSTMSVWEPEQGINAAGDQLTIVFALPQGFSFGDVESALRTGDLRLALRASHVGTSGLNEVVINAPESVMLVPLPSPVLAGLVGLVGLACGRRRRVLDGKQ